jgi:hypothetical protein
MRSSGIHDGFPDEDNHSDGASTTSSDSAQTSEDEDVVNVRVAPAWDKYRYLFEKWGFHLDTCRDVKLFYMRYWASRNIQSNSVSSPGYSLALRGKEDELCKDVGLVSTLFSFPRNNSDQLHLSSQKGCSEGPGCVMA